MIHMQIGEVIRKYRKNKNITQENMAARLGITASAVNKWENGNAFPDIMLLAPIARLLEISIDTLLSYQEELEAKEIETLVKEANTMLKTKTFEEALEWGKKQLERYPNCELLIWQIAVIFDAQRLKQKISNEEKYDEYFCSLYKRVLESKEEEIRNYAADSLFSFYMRKEQYEEAQKCLNYFSKQNPQRKRKQAEIYRKRKQIKEAYKTYEELLWMYAQMVTQTLDGLSMLALEEENYEKAHKLVAKQVEIAKCFEMGKYYEMDCRLELATIEKDADFVITIMNEMLSSVEEINGFCKSSLFEHMEFKPIDEEFKKELKSNLIECFQDEETYGFLKQRKEWKELMKNQQ